MKTNTISLRNDQVSIKYRQAGSGATTLLFLHGWCINGSYWDQQMEYFADRYQVLAPDLPGFGESTADRPNWSIEEYAKDVIAFIHALNLREVILVCHSMSGAIGLQSVLSADPRITGMIGTGTFEYVDYPFSEEQMGFFTQYLEGLATDFGTVAPQYAKGLLFHETTSPEVIDRVSNDFAQTNPAIGYASFMKLLEFGASEGQKLAQLPWKLHLINTDSPPTFETGLQTHLQHGYAIAVVPACGHYPMIEKPAVFNAELEGRLKEMGA